MKKIKNVDFLLGDFLNSAIKKKIEIFFNQKIDIVISDMASNTTGNKDLDSYRTNELCINAMQFARSILKKEGIFVSKFFMGTEFEEIKRLASSIFKKIVNFKPNSSQKQSRELYIIGKNIIN
jgi:23S rRNA U2552 (ribose-2'-O)-methylase RlmE/FtsJ